MSVLAQRQRKEANHEHHSKIKKDFFSLSLFILYFVSQDMLEAFEAIQGKFRQIRSLTRRQKDHLKRFHGGNETSHGNINVYQIHFFFLNSITWGKKFVELK